MLMRQMEAAEGEFSCCATTFVWHVERRRSAFSFCLRVLSEREDMIRSRALLHARESCCACAQRWPDDIRLEEVIHGSSGRSRALSDDGRSRSTAFQSG